MGVGAACSFLHRVLRDLSAGGFTAGVPHREQVPRVPRAGAGEPPPNHQGLRGRRRLNTETSKGVIEAKSPGFEANDLGFESRVDSWSVNTPLQYRNMVPNRWTRSFQVDFVPLVEHNFDGDLVDASLFVGSVQQWANYWQSSTAVALSPGRYTDAATRGGPVMRRPSGGSLSQWISTDRRKSHTMDLSATYSWNEWGGCGVFTQASLNLRPGQTIELSLAPVYKGTHAVAQYVRSVADPTAVHL